MLTNLSIKNFRSIKALDIDLGNITCIVGESANGKSNALRAVKWVMLNRPSSKRIIRWGRKNCQVSIEQNGHLVNRKRGTSENSYTVDDLVLKAFGSKIPDRVRKVFPVSEINFQTQQEMPPGEGPLFWFALSPGQVSKKINQIVNLEIIDRTLSKIQSRARATKAEVHVCRERKRQAKEKTNRLLFVQDLASDWEKVVGLKKETEKFPEKIELLEALLEDIQKQSEALENTGSSLSLMEKELISIEKMYDYIQRQMPKLNFLEELITDVKEQQQTTKDLKREVIVKEKLYIESRGNECPLCGSPLTNL
jgi:DNA repair ATPase RecN